MEHRPEGIRDSQNSPGVHRFHFLPLFHNRKQVRGLVEAKRAHMFDSGVEVIWLIS